MLSSNESEKARSSLTTNAMCKVNPWPSTPSSGWSPFPFTRPIYLFIYLLKKIYFISTSSLVFGRSFLLNSCKTFKEIRGGITVRLAISLPQQSPFKTFLLLASQGLEYHTHCRREGKGETIDKVSEGRKTNTK